VATGIKYLLRATFTSSKTAENGTWNYTETDGSIAVSGGEAVVTPQSTPNWGDLGCVSDALSAGAGKGFKFTLNSSDYTKVVAGGWTDNGLALANLMNAIIVQSDKKVDIYQNGSVTATDLVTLTDSQEYKFVIVLGGYDSSGVPLSQASDISTYDYGADFFYHDGSNWNLIWKSASIQDSGQDYPALSFYDYDGNYDYTVVADKDLSSTKVPVALDTFTDSDSTSLDAHTMDVGSGWTEEVGFTILSNYADSDTASDGAAHTETNISDLFLEATIMTSSGNGAIIIRLTDNDNFWIIDLYRVSNESVIYEKNEGVYTARASASQSIASGKRVAIIANGSTISAVYDNGNKVSYSSATFNQTATKHGLRSGTGSGSNLQYDNFAVYPLTGSQYDILDTV